MTVPAPRQAPPAQRTRVQLLELLGKRVSEYRTAFLMIGSAIRPDYCMGCRITQHIINDTDHAP